MPQSGRMQGWRSLKLAVPVLVLVIALAVAGCSSSGGGGGSNYSLGLAGSTADHHGQPPTIPAKGPGGTYAFVYDNQIWLRQDGQAQAKQLTHLVLSNGATLLWGPLIWSTSGNYIAFSLVENLTPDAPTRTSGPLYYVDTRPGPHFGETSLTGGTGSIYGHSYAWWDDYAIFYSSGSGVMLYDLGDCDPRVWQAISPFARNPYDGKTNYSGDNVTFTDIAIIPGNRLFATRITLQSLGSTSQVGSAAIYSYPLPSLSDYEKTHDPSCSNDYIPGWLNRNFQNAHLANGGYVRYDLGIAYADPAGNIVAGSWQLARSSNNVARQYIDGIDTKSGTVSSRFSVDENSGVLRGAGKYPITAHPAIAISSNGNHISFAANKLYVDDKGAISDAGGSAAPAWGGPGDDVAVATQLVSQSTDVGGVVRSQTNVVAYSGGTASVLIAGAQDLSWKP